MVHPLRISSDVAQRMAANGASCPFRWVLANVSSPNPQRPLTLSGGSAPKATFATASKMGSPKWLNARRWIKEQRPHRVRSYMMTAAIKYREQRMIKRVVLAMGLEDHMHTREPTKSTAISDVAAAELRRAAERLGAKWAELDSGHYPMLSLPTELTSLLTAG